MRIFCAIRHANDPKQFYGGLWRANFYPALRELGHEVVESQVDLLPTSRFMGVAHGFTREELEVRARTTDQILAEVRAANERPPVDLFLSYFYNAHFDPAGFDDLRRLGIPSVNFYCNSVQQFSQVSAIAAKVDYSWHAERDARGAYLAVGARPVWVQMGADPRAYHPVADVSRKALACFVGQRYADRDRCLAVLVEAKVPLDIYGSGWGKEETHDQPDSRSDGFYLGRQQLQPGSARSYLGEIASTFRRDGLIKGAARVVGQARQRSARRRCLKQLAPCVRGRAPEIASTLAAYEVCLNFSNVWADGRPGSALIPHVRLRDFEAPMCRSCYLTGHTDEIAHFYELGREIDTYRTTSELVEKSHFYLKHPESAEKLREAGYRRALRDHTWKRRFDELFTKLGCKP